MQYCRMESQCIFAKPLAPNSSAVFVSFEWDTTRAQEFLEKKRAESNLPVTLTHFVGLAASRALANQPDLNGRLSFGNYIPKDTLGISFLVSLDNGKDLGACTVEKIDEKSIEEICQELTSTSKKIRSHTDKQHAQRTGALGFIPTFILEPIMFIMGYITSNLGISLPMLGFKKYPFGTCVITSVGMLGYEHVFVPLPPYTNVPLLITVGGTKRKPIAVGDEVKIRDVINVTLTLDHRYTDGARAMEVYRKFVDGLHDPESCVKSAREQEIKSPAQIQAA
eukprot:TRINITY_DN3324_c0_g3_i2.p1 TRINITY_DN3324_c0_g3~~TRINITY_DN3324_c0_g3_i2.p1  ORF type:complete len:280 (+),score=29.54 TRINITY_DN3324_c0_g3_i2:194-1033(+)